MMEYDMIPQPCRACGYRADALTQVSGDPVPRRHRTQASICFACGEVSIMEFGPLGVVMREPTTAELLDIQQNNGAVLHRIQQARMVVRAKMQHRPAG